MSDQMFPYFCQPKIAMKTNEKINNIFIFYLHNDKQYKQTIVEMNSNSKMLDNISQKL